MVLNFNIIISHWFDTIRLVNKVVAKIMVKNCFTTCIQGWIQDFPKGQCVHGHGTGAREGAQKPLPHVLTLAT